AELVEKPLHAFGLGFDVIGELTLEKGLTKAGQVGHDDAKVLAQAARHAREVIAVAVETVQQHKWLAVAAFEKLPVDVAAAQAAGLELPSSALGGQQQMRQWLWPQQPERRPGRQPDQQCDDPDHHGSMRPSFDTEIRG